MEKLAVVFVVLAFGAVIVVGLRKLKRAGDEKYRDHINHLD